MPHNQVNRYPKGGSFPENGFPENRMKTCEEIMIRSIPKTFQSHAGMDGGGGRCQPAGAACHTHGTTKKERVGMDRMWVGVSPSKRIAVTWVSATETVRTLEGRHLSGPTAALALGEGVVACALLSSLLGKGDERVSVQVQCDGPLGGLLVDAGYDGRIRGYTNTKIMNALDGDPDLPAALGTRTSFTVIQSSATGILNTGTVQASPPDLRVCLARYIHESLQRTAGVAMHVALEAYSIHAACGLFVEKMPDAVSGDFVPVLEAFEDGRVRAALRGGDDPETLAERLCLPDLEVKATRPLRFGCLCSQDRAQGAVASMTTEELRACVLKEEAQDVHCHFCGAHYKVGVDAMLALLDSRVVGER